MSNDTIKTLLDELEPYTDTHCAAIYLKALKVLAARVEALEKRQHAPDMSLSSAVKRMDERLIELEGDVLEIERHPALSIPPLEPASGGPKREQGLESIHATNLPITDCNCWDCEEARRRIAVKPPPREADAGQERLANLEIALRKIIGLVLHSEPVGCVSAILDIANESLKHVPSSNAQSPPPAPAATDETKLRAVSPETWERISAATERQEQPSGAFYAWWLNETTAPWLIPKGDVQLLESWCQRAFAAGRESQWREAVSEYPNGFDAVLKVEGCSLPFVAWVANGKWFTFHGAERCIPVDRRIEAILPLPPLPKGEAS